VDALDAALAHKIEAFCLVSQIKEPDAWPQGHGLLKRCHSTVLVVFKRSLVYLDRQFLPVSGGLAKFGSARRVLRRAMLCHHPTDVGRH